LTGGQGRALFLCIAGEANEFSAGYPSRASSKRKKEFIQVAGIADFDPKARATERR